MILNKIKKFFHRLIRSFATDKIIYLPAIILFLFALTLIMFVYFSDTTDFAPCTIESIGCTENINELPKTKQIKKIFVCASKTVWCDTQVLFQKCSKKKQDIVSPIPDDKKNDQLSPEELDQLFEKVNAELEKNIPSEVDGEKLMEEARKERLEGEKHFQELIDSLILADPKNENQTNGNK